MRTWITNPREAGRDWPFAVAAGFVALTLFGAAVDRGNAVVDRSFARSRSVERTVAPLTNLELVREMATHD